MDENIKMHGTKGAIAESILGQLQIQNPEEVSAMKRYVDTLIDTLETNYRSLPEGERIRKESPRGYDSNQGFLTEDAVYFVNMKKMTFLLFSVVAKLKLENVCGPVASAFIESFLEAQFQGEDLALFGKLNNAEGESCVALEAMKAREKGISRELFTGAKKFGIRRKVIEGRECGHNEFFCGLRRGTQCLCDEERTESICEKLAENRILIKKGRKYYYTDFL